MTDAPPDFEIFLVTAPGLEAALAEEALELGFAAPVATPGGVTFRGSWTDVWRANLDLRGATHVLVRIASFRVMHLAQLDKRARRVEWQNFLRPDVAVSVEATCRKSKIYHAGAAAQRIARAIAEELGAPVRADAQIRVLARIEDDLCTISIDSSGDSLHKRGHKEAVNRAPMRETMAALLLRQCGYSGAEPVLDPMCGSGTFVIEAAEMALGLQPGRSRSFAFEQLAGFDASATAALRRRPAGNISPHTFFGSDRDAGAIEMSRANAERAGVTASTRFEQRPIAELTRPEGPPGLVIINPPYGDRIGHKAALAGLYRSLGDVLQRQFSGWRVGLVATDLNLVRATTMPFRQPAPSILHGGLRIALHQTGPLP